MNLMMNKKVAEDARSDKPITRAQTQKARNAINKAAEEVSQIKRILDPFSDLRLIDDINDLVRKLNQMNYQLGISE